MKGHWPNESLFPDLLTGINAVGLTKKQYAALRQYRGLEKSDVDDLLWAAAERVNKKIKTKAPITVPDLMELASMKERLPKMSYQEHGESKRTFRLLVTRLFRDLACGLGLGHNNIRVRHHNGHACLHQRNCDYHERDRLFILIDLDRKCPGILGLRPGEVNNFLKWEDHLGKRNNWFTLDALVKDGVPGLVAWAKGVMAVKGTDEMAEMARIWALLKQDIDVLEPSVRAENCLRAAQLHTLGDLVKMSEVDLLRFKSLGKRTLTEIKEARAPRLRLEPGDGRGRAGASGSRGVAPH